MYREEAQQASSTTAENLSTSASPVNARTGDFTSMSCEAPQADRVSGIVREARHETNASTAR